MLRFEEKPGRRWTHIELFVYTSMRFVNCPVMLNTDPHMADTFNYTTIYAPLGFFVMGVVSVLLLNKFIGKDKEKQAE